MITSRFDRLLIHSPDGLVLASGGREIQVAGRETRSFAISRWSPRAVVSVDAANGEQLLLLQESGRVSHVHDSPLPIQSLTWGPDDSTVSFVVQPDDGVARLKLLDLRSGRLGEVKILDVPHLAADPSWSTDGRWLAIEAQPTQQLRGMTVFLYDRAERSLTLVDPLEEPEPKSACQTFAPNEPILAYAYAVVGALDSQVRLFAAHTGRRAVAEGVGLNDPRWSQDGDSLLAVAHTSICQTNLVRVDALSLRVHTLLLSAEHLEPLYLDTRVALFVARTCHRTDMIPTEPGELRLFDLSSGQVELIARPVYRAMPMLAGGNDRA